MSRNGSGVYTLPAGSTIANGDTSDADDLNIPLADIETDMNTPRPVVAGGTGASSVAAAQTTFKIAPKDTASTISALWTFTGGLAVDSASQGLGLTDSTDLNFGTGADASINFDGTNWIFADTSVGTLVKAASFKVQNAAGTEDMIEAVEDGFVKLRYNNVATLTTTSTGVTVTGAVSADTAAGTWFLDEDDMASDSATKIASQQSIRAYVLSKANWAQNTPQTTTSGTAFDFTGIEAGCNKIDILLNGVSLSGTDNLLIQLIVSASPVTTGYVSSSEAVSSTSGYIVYQASAATGAYGTITLNRMPSTNNWLASGVTQRSTGSTASSAGYGVGGGTVEGIRVTRTGTNTFDAGQISIRWRV